jgi:tRNA1Val (adenine37-N6)-methyltransferase
VQVIHNSFQEFCQTKPEAFDLLVCNPPFFHNSLKPGCNKRELARHSSILKPEELLEGAMNILTPDGRLLLIIPATQANEITLAAKNNHLYPGRKIWIIPTPGKPPKRVIIEFSLQGGAINETSLVIEDKGRHGYSEEYKILTRDYYLFL